MQKARTQNKIKETFENPFEEAHFRDFVRNLLNHIEEVDGHPYSGQFIATAFQPYISTLKRIGKYSDGEHEIDILVVQLKKETSLERARTAQRNFIARYLNGSRGGKMKDAALVAFVSPNETDWRFSLIKMDYKFTEGKNGKTKVKEEFTPARRWSFLVGPNEHSHTAQAKLAPIIEDENVITLERLEDAFNIEKVTKEFFEKYRNLFADVKEALDKILVSNVNIRNDFDDKFVSSVDFSKRLLGQLVFLYFLQKKGWFGVPKDKKWGEGDKNFLRNLFKGEYLKYKNFYNDILEPLFYDALALDRSHLDHWNDHFQCKIPFLNGGLFDNKYNWHETEIELPNDLFSNDYFTKEKDKGTGILDIFDRYNFTVKEDEPLEKEVAIDPEMLGKVFENLLEVKDRKSKGTYYTPREIVHYMCEQSLVNYLATELKDKVSKEDVEKLIKSGENVVEHEAIHVAKKENNPNYDGLYDQKLPASIEKFAKEIDERLATIKVCDPAIGSGAFPVGMMNAIVKARMVLNSYLCHSREGGNPDTERTLYTFKRDCIQNSLYGVDLDPGAVEIAKLRLWLSLVVDEDDIKQIKPLPNLDYKIMQGNSLLEEFEGIKLFDEKLIAVVDTSKEEQVDAIKQKQAVLQKEYFELHSQNKLTTAKQVELNAELKKLKIQLKKLNNSGLPAEASAKAGLFDVYSEAKKKADNLKRLHKEFFEATQKSKKDNIKRQIEQLEWELIEATLKEQNKTSALKKLEEFKRSNTKSFFLWKLNFADVFEEKGGFDVVIANPPYISYGLRGGQKITPQEKETLRRTFPNSAEYKISMYALFMDKAIQLARSNGGVQTFIVPDSFLLGRYFSKVRSFILESNTIHNILLLPYSVFDAAVGFSVVYCFQKIFNDPQHLITARFAESNEEVANANYQQLIYPQSYFESTKYNRFRLFFNTEIKNLISKIDNQSIELGSAYIGRTGVRSKIGQKNIISKEKKLETHQKGLISGGQITRYHIKYEGDYINIDASLLNSGGWDYKVMHNPKILIRQTGDSLIASIDINNFYHLNNVHSFAPKAGTNLELEYALSVLNSKLMNFYYQKTTLEAGRVMAQTDIETIESLPIKEVLESQQKPLINLVGKILKITKADDYLKNAEKQAKVRDIEHQIDELVYKLYGLTNDEIKIVEGVDK